MRQRGGGHFEAGGSRSAGIVKRGDYIPRHLAARVRLGQGIQPTDSMTKTQREVYILTNPAMPGLVKVGLATAGVENRAHSLASHAGVPSAFEVVGVYGFPPEIDFKDLLHIEREAHLRLAPFRYTEGKEFFKTTPEQAGSVLHQLQTEARDNLALGLTPTGGTRQGVLVDAPREQARFRRATLIPLKPPQHWHVWQEREKEGGRVSVVQLFPRTYWTKGGGNGRVKRDKAKGTYTICVLCQDTACPDFRKTLPSKNGL